MIALADLLLVTSISYGISEILYKTMRCIRKRVVIEHTSDLSRGAHTHAGMPKQDGDYDFKKIRSNQSAFRFMLNRLVFSHDPHCLFPVPATQCRDHFTFPKASHAA
jgi:hypothetical protein